MSCTIVHYGKVDSTNRILKELVLTGVCPPFAVSATAQTAGRGRLGRLFVSPEGGIYISFLFDYKPEVKLTCMAAVAVRRAVLKVCGISCDIKWVNDLYFRGKKVCGILAEACGNRVVLGIGINLSCPESDLPEIAGSLNQDYSLAAKLEEEIADQLYGELTGWLEEYRAADMLLGKKVEVLQADKKTAEGVACGIDDCGCLCVVEENGNQVILSTGEVSIRSRE